MVDRDRLKFVLSAITRNLPYRSTDFEEAKRIWAGVFPGTYAFSYVHYYTIESYFDGELFDSDREILMELARTLLSAM